LSDLSFAKSNNILGGVTYEFKVVAVNIVGDSESSPALSILAAQVPTAPLNLHMLSADKTSITVQWSAPSSDGSTPITGYKLYWDESTGIILPDSIGDTTWQTLQFTQSGLDTDRYYIFAVSAINIVGESPTTSSESIITATVPGVPQALSMKSQSQTHIEIQW
jgi:titin